MRLWPRLYAIYVSHMESGYVTTLSAVGSHRLQAKDKAE